MHRQPSYVEIWLAWLRGSILLHVVLFTVGWDSLLVCLPVSVCIEIQCLLFVCKLNCDVFVFPITHSSLASMTSSTESRYWPSYVLGKIKSLWSVGGSNAGLNQLAASATGMPLPASFVRFVTCLLYELQTVMEKDVAGA